MDNGPEMIAWAIRDYCRLAGVRTTYIEPGSPWENPFVESFNSRARDELFNVEEFATLHEAQVIVEAWRTEYNTYRPHSSLRRSHSRRVRGHWTSNNQLELSNGWTVQGSATKVVHRTKAVPDWYHGGYGDELAAE